MSCEFPNGMSIKPDGVNELDPCIYEDIEKYENVTVIISRCTKCGKIEIGWKRQPNTRQIMDDDEDEENDDEDEE